MWNHGGSVAIGGGGGGGHVHGGRGRSRGHDHGGRGGRRSSSLCREGGRRKAGVNMLSVVAAVAVTMSGARPGVMVMAIAFVGQGCVGMVLGG